MFNREERMGQWIGFSAETSRAYFFFGNKFLTRENIPMIFPEYKFCFLKQVHGNKVVPADFSTTLEADAHFTCEPNLALVSQTADCVPILLANDETVCAIHSGWKGAAQNIVQAAASVFQGPPQIAAVGPHIMVSSFEVGLDVADQLVRAAPMGTAKLQLPHRDPGKVYFDLTELVCQQIAQACGPLTKIVECLADTPSVPDFHSYRRDRAQAGRQYSFVVLKE